MADIEIARSASQPWDDERRQDPRVPVQQEARLELGDASHAAVVLNISGGGALVKTDAPAKAGDVVELAAKEWGRFRAEVRRVGDNGLGLMFLEEITRSN